MMQVVVESVQSGDHDVFSQGKALREPIFYGRESAYGFQYRDFSVDKFRNDNQWLRKNRGLSIEEARHAVFAIQQHIEAQSPSVLREMRNTPVDRRTVLPCFTIDIDAIERRSGLSGSAVRSLFECLSVPSGDVNRAFCSVGDFNVANAAPLIPTGDGKTFLLFNVMSLCEALYVGPYYWMFDDSAYRDRAAENRGKFAEEFVRGRLRDVFGDARVYSNVVISSTNGDVLGEIDVLVIYGDRAIVAQVKSKQLTLEARRGNDNQIRADFKKSTQDSYDQAEACARLLLTPSGCQFLAGGTSSVPVPDSLSEVYPMCVVSDHYPALGSQIRTFLRYSSDRALQPPMVIDVFALDVMTEMLASPVKTLSFINRRVNYHEQVIAHDELTILAYHLQYNLWVDSKYGLVSYGDEFTMALDVAMIVRRTGVSGERRVEGYLEEFRSTRIGKIVDGIERHPEPETVDIAFVLLCLKGDAVRELSDAIDRMTAQARADGRHHDASLEFDGLGKGMTIHCNRESIGVAAGRLKEHCEVQKYRRKTKAWYGICIGPDGSVRLGERVVGEWERDSAMERKVAEFGNRSRVIGGAGRPRVGYGKIGRNARCPCGGGKKYKHCCME